MTTTATLNPLYWSRSRDDYGRSCHHLFRRGIAIGVAVKLPRVCVARHPERAYLTNDWTLPSGHPDRVKYHRTLADAKRRIEDIAARSAR